MITSKTKSVISYIPEDADKLKAEALSALKKINPVAWLIIVATPVLYNRTFFQTLFSISLIGLRERGFNKYMKMVISKC